jgi:hypothetical protein
MGLPPGEQRGGRCEARHQRGRAVHRRRVHGGFAGPRDRRAALPGPTVDGRRAAGPRGRCRVRRVPGAAEPGRAGVLRGLGCPGDRVRGRARGPGWRQRRRHRAALAHGTRPVPPPVVSGDERRLGRVLCGAYPPGSGNPNRRYARRWVSLVAHFDDPAAQTCHAEGPADADPPTEEEAVAMCRQILVLSSIGVTSAPDTATAAAPADTRRDVPALVFVAAGLVGLAAWAGRRRARPAA